VLKRVAIVNYRALRKVQIQLSPLTAFVGPNASGKSSLLRAFSPAGVTTSDAWRQTLGLEVSFHWWADNGSGAVSTHANRHGNWPNRPYSFQTLKLELDQLRAPQTVAAATALTERGANLTNLFESLPRVEKANVARELCGLVPVFQDVDTIVPQGQQGTKEFRFQDRWEPNVWYRANDVSDGTMLVLAFLLLRYQTPAPTLLAIEDPERGLHPYLMGKLVELLRSLTVAKGDHQPVQILLATQSAELLNHLDPSEVRFLSKDPTDGSVVVEGVQTSDPGWEKAYEAHLKQLGSVWLSGGVGGVPAV
jgi:predicted ATPase